METFEGMSADDDFEGDDAQDVAWGDDGVSYDPREDQYDCFGCEVDPERGFGFWDIVAGGGLVEWVPCPDRERCIGSGLRERPDPYIAADPERGIPGRIPVCRVPAMEGWVGWWDEDVQGILWEHDGWSWSPEYGRMVSDMEAWEPEMDEIMARGLHVPPPLPPVSGEVFADPLNWLRRYTAGVAEHEPERLGHIRTLLEAQWGHLCGDFFTSEEFEEGLSILDGFEPQPRGEQ